MAHDERNTAPEVRVDYQYNNTHRQLSESIHHIGHQQFKVERLYDNSGELSQLTYPSGNQVRYLRDAKSGQVVSVTTESRRQFIADTIRYLPDGPMRSLVLSNGHSVSYRYDTDYRLQAVNSPNLQLSYRYVGAGNITDITDALKPIHSARYHYDAQSRLKSAIQHGHHLHL